MITEILSDVVAQPPRRRRWPWLVVAAFGLAIAIGIASRALLGHYSPMQISGSYLPTAWHRVAPLGGSDQVITYAADFNWGRDAEYGIDVANRGPLGISIEGITLPDAGALLLFRPRAVELSAEPDAGGLEPEIPFKRFFLAPGRDRWMYVHGTFTDCQFSEAGSANEFGSVGIRFSVWGMRRVQDVPLGFALRVVSPAASDCPTAEQLGAIHTSIPVHGVFTRVTHLQACIKAAIEETCYALADRYDIDGAAEIGKRVTLTPGSGGRIQSIQAGG